MSMTTHDRYSYEVSTAQEQFLLMRKNPFFEIDQSSNSIEQGEISEDATVRGCVCPM